MMEQKLGEFRISQFHSPEKLLELLTQIEQSPNKKQWLAQVQELGNFRAFKEVEKYIDDYPNGSK